MNRHLFLSLLLALFASSTLSADNLRIELPIDLSGRGKRQARQV